MYNAVLKIMFHFYSGLNNAIQQKKLHASCHLNLYIGGINQLVFITGLN